MSYRSPRVIAQSQSSSLSSSQHSELAQKIEKFHQVAQDLLRIYEQPEQERNGLPPSTKATSGEVRCYYLSPGTVQHERELLRRYRAEDFRGLLAEAHMLLVGLVKVMKSTHHDVKVKGNVIASLGCLLEQVSILLLRMKNVYDRFESINKR